MNRLILIILIIGVILLILQQSCRGYLIDVNNPMDAIYIQEQKESATAAPSNDDVKLPEFTTDQIMDLTFSTDTSY